MVYVPVLSMGENATYKQQSWYFTTQGDIRCPRKILLEDLGKEIQQAMDEGDQIIVGGDVNMEITRSQ